MPKLDEPAFLLRADLQLPTGLKLMKRNFREGWEAVRKSDGRALGSRAKQHGWQLLEDAKPLLKGGQGKTPEAATACALKLALQDISESFNAVRVEYLQTKQYPWFFLANIAVYPRSIRPGTNHLSAAAPPLPQLLLRNQDPSESVQQFPSFGTPVGYAGDLFHLV